MTLNRELQVIDRRHLVSTQFAEPREIQAAGQRQVNNLNLRRSARKRLTVPTANPAAEFQPLLPASGFNNYISKYKREGALSAAGVIAGFFGGLGGGITALVFAMNAVNPLIPLAGLAISIAAFSWGWAMDGPITRSYNEVNRLAQERFSTWLRERHGIEVNWSSADRNLLDQLLRPTGGSFSRYKFRAEDGNQYALVNSNDLFHIERDGEPVQVEPKKAKKSKPLKSVEALVTAPSVEFSGEAGELFTQVKDLISKLSGQQLQAEEEHAVKRTLEDLNTLVDLNEKLQSLAGPTEADQSNFILTLAALKQEMLDILEYHQLLVSQDVATQAEYVQQRRPATREGLRLALEKPESI